MCRFQCNQQCCPIKQAGTPADVAKLEKEFARNNNVTFFSPDSSDDSEDDEQTMMPAEHRYNYNFLQSCQDNFFRSFQDNKFVKSFHGSSSISTPSDSDSEESLDTNNSQQNDSGEEENKSQSSMDGSSSFRLKSILSTCGKSSPATQKHAFERRVSFADRRRVDFLFGELDFNEVNFPDDASDYWRTSLHEKSQPQVWSVDELAEVDVNA
uniref:Uncharacterized protein n=1 Tax=Globodera rostochiensis TaxID=31243 RepID=A0A914H8H0_GLORO